MHRNVTRPLRELAVLAVVVSLLSGCSAEPAPEPAPSTSSAAPAPTATPTPDGPALQPEGSAEDNLPLFTQVMDQVWDSTAKVKGRAYIDALTEAGFDRDAMEVTNDVSTVGNAAESIQFAVLWDEDCIVGQVGPSTKTPTAVVMPELPDGGCLVGETRPIDW